MIEKVIYGFGILVLFFFSCQKKETSQKHTNSPSPYAAHFSDADKATSPETVVKIQHYYQKIWEEGNLWGAFLVAKGDRILYENYRGFADESHSQLIDKGTPLHIASISKPLTAMAVLKLVEQGKLSLDTPISEIFKGFSYKGVTVKNLLNQRSGLPKYEHFMPDIAKKNPKYQKAFWTNGEILEAMILHPPDIHKAPETGFAYCNTNYALLALIVEKLTKKKFPDAMNTLIFQPLKMKNSFIFQPKDTLTAAKSFYSKNEKPFAYDALDMVYGDKNVYTTPRDLLLFSTALYSGKFLNPMLQEQLFIPYSNEKPGVKNYGLGFRLKTYQNAKILPYHTGWWHGTNAVFGHLLDEKVTIIAIGNKFSKGPYTALALASLFGDYPVEKMKYEIAMELIAKDSVMMIEE